MKITFILPCVGKIPGRPYVKTWKMEPLAISTLSALTPTHIEKEFFDDRLEPIDYETKTDLVAISVETYTARRAYQIAKKFKERGVPVVMGGFHATLMPDETALYADSVVVGYAEGIWENVCLDVAADNLQEKYYAVDEPVFRVLPDRSIYSRKKYANLTLIETGRGCRFNCEFCSIKTFFKRNYHHRPIDDIFKDIKRAPSKNIFFVDDNFVVDRKHTKALLKKIVPLKKRWVGQMSVDAAQDKELLALMHKSGCMGVLIGFESLNPNNLDRMDKVVNKASRGFEQALANIEEAGLGVYATFLFGYDEDREEDFQNTLEFAIRHKFFFAAFNHLVPFPGTELYERMKQENRLLHENWWLSKNYRFGDIAFTSKQMDAETLKDTCLQYRKKFYSWPSILTRANAWQTNCRNLLMTGLFFSQNYLSRNDVLLRQGLPLGAED